MGGKCPKSIITDQDRGMASAIPTIFKDATHRCCLFHVKKNIDDKGGPVFQANEGLYEEMQDIIDKSLTVHEFETLWQAMITEYKVGHIKIFQDIWKSRQKWVPVYFKNKFFPFIQTTARSEGTNALFKKGVGPQFSMTSFLREYQRIMDTMHANEDELDHNVVNKRVKEKKFLTEYYIERQAHELYNISIFRKFQRILNDVTRLQIREDEKGKIYWVFQAKNYPIKEHRHRDYLVQVNLQNQDYSCICCKFDKDGLLCSHILKVMLQLQIDKIPEKYIIDRWRKRQKKLFNLPAPPENEDNIVLRFNVLSRLLGYTASTGSKTKRNYQYLLQEIPRIEAEMARMNNEDEQVSEMGQNSSARTVVNLDPTAESASNIHLLDPDVADTKGRPRLLTIKERIKQNKFYSCSHCGSNKHTKKNCDKLHLVFNLPKKPRKQKKRDNGSQTEGHGTKTKKSKKATEPNDEHQPLCQPSVSSSVNPNQDGN
ncbi:protein FAR1-RELATED SEQUENCE 5-like [Lolium perenne]|uniref:protein FAR1-RELATED SEQUENCE 5-like n=1 Tax=Lolium perenne TaxID=4522 RepID=UPI0021F57F11|nr:protein FAR-RED IMPAIRED RESPONSE 1-like [Lolium perenne]